MNITPVSNSLEITLKSNQIGKRCLISDNQPVPESPKDEVVFKGSYEKVIKEALSDKLSSAGEINAYFSKIYAALGEAIESKSIKATKDFSAFRALFRNHSFTNIMEKLASSEKYLNNSDNCLLEQLQKLSAKSDVTLATVDGMPVFQLRKRGLDGVINRKNLLTPENLYEFSFKSPGGGSEIIVGMTKKGGLSVEQKSNMTVPKYTLFHSDDKRGGIKVLMRGVPGDDNFSGKYFDRNGYFGPFISLLIR